MKEAPSEYFVCVCVCKNIIVCVQPTLSSLDRPISNIAFRIQRGNVFRDKALSVLVIPHGTF